MNNKITRPMRTVATTLLSLSLLHTPSHAAPAVPPTATPVLNQSVISRIRTLMDNPNTWRQIPPAVTLCVYSPDGARGKNFQQALSYMSEIPKYTQMAKDMGLPMHPVPWEPVPVPERRVM